jgi:sensor histidine kinase YesM
MTFSITMDPNAAEALVPSLILQPLIENAIKHGVGVLPGRVEISLTARRENDRLHVTIENDMPRNGAEITKPSGVGVGLRNVADRLHARFQNECVMRSGPMGNDRFEVSLELPWRTA